VVHPEAQPAAPYYVVWQVKYTLKVGLSLSLALAGCLGGLGVDRTAV